MARESLYLDPVPLDLAWNDPDENLKRIDAAIAERLKASPDIPSEARLFVFPEVTLTAFVTEDPKSFTIDPPDEYIKRLTALAAKHHTGIVAGFPETGKDAKPLNALLLIGPEGKVEGCYRKMHLFTVGETPESEKYSAGGAGAVVLYRGWNIGLSICFDARFPRLYHAYAQAGVDLVVVSSCWVGGPHKTYQYRTINSAHAILTQAYVVAVNRAGADPNFEFDGAAYVFSPFGENLFDGTPVSMEEKTLADCRKLVVRPSDRDSYPVNFDSAKG